MCCMLNVTLLIVFTWGGEKKGEGRKTERQNKNNKKKTLQILIGKLVPLGEYQLQKV